MSRLKVFLLNRLHFLRMEELQLTDQTVKEFEELFERYIKNGEEGLIEYNSKTPKHHFLNYLIENKGVLVHGSNHSEITNFEPREQSLFTGKPVKAVFASSDGVWSTFFACIRREGYVGSLRNACLTSSTKKGIRRYYYFSVNKEHKGDLWTEGTIYILPKESFKQGGIKDEWICEEEVKPLAKLSVTPEDFPFKEQVSRHNEKDSVLKTMVRVLLLNKVGV